MYKRRAFGGKHAGYNFKIKMLVNLTHLEPLACASDVCQLSLAFVMASRVITMNRNSSFRFQATKTFVFSQNVKSPHGTSTNLQNRSAVHTNIGIVTKQVATSNPKTRHRIFSFPITSHIIGTKTKAIMCRTGPWTKYMA